MAGTEAGGASSWRNWCGGRDRPSLRAVRRAREPDPRPDGAGGAQRAAEHSRGESWPPGTSKKTELKLTNVARAEAWKSCGSTMKIFCGSVGSPAGGPPMSGALKRCVARRSRRRLWVKDEQGTDTDEQGQEDRRSCGVRVCPCSSFFVRELFRPSGQRRPLAPQPGSLPAGSAVGEPGEGFRKRGRLYGSARTELKPEEKGADRPFSSVRSAPPQQPEAGRRPG